MLQNDEDEPKRYEEHDGVMTMKEFLREWENLTPDQQHELRRLMLALQELEPR